MAGRAQAVLLFFAGMSFVQSNNADPELKLDQALLTVASFLPERVGVLYVSDACYQCQPQLLLTVEPALQGRPSNVSTAVSTRFPLAMEVFVGRNATDVVCRWRQLYGEQGQYLVSVKRDLAGKNQTDISCARTVQKEPENSYIPDILGLKKANEKAGPLGEAFQHCKMSQGGRMRRELCSMETTKLLFLFLFLILEHQALWIAFAVLVALTLLYFLGSYIFMLPCTQERCHWLQCKSVSHEANSPECPRPVAEVTKRRRLLSLDTFRGLSLTLMIFVNYGGGGYWFLEHAAWNGLTVADLVMAWFVFIIGTSVALAFHAMTRRGVSRMQLARKATWRTVILFVIGVSFLNYGPVDGPLSWSWARIPGVLQRLAFTYFVLALMEACFGRKDFDSYQFGNWWASIRDILLYWPEWIIVAALETLWLCLTFMLPVPGCPSGYLGPGGIGDDGKYPNCTGGSAGYIDRWLLGENHIYHYPTCKELYKTTQPFDPEGVLGTINSIVMAFFGLQAGKIILMYRQQPQSILKRFLIWAIVLGIISAILSKCTQNEGFIPINKNLWSLSYVTTLSSFSFVLLGITFYLVDVRNWWGGQPFIFPGMNSIFVYVGHSLLGSYFPFNWETKSPASHAEPLFQDLLGTSIWVFIAYLLYKKKFFLKI